MNSASLPTSRRIVIDTLLQHLTMSRSDIAETTGLSRSVITAVTQELIDLGMLEELPVVHARQGRGRPSVMLSFSPSYGYFLGVSISDCPAPMVIINLRGEIVGACVIQFHPKPAGMVASIRKGLTQLLRETGVVRQRVCGLGIAITGIVEAGTGICRYSAALNWRDVPIGAMVERAIGITTHLDNDANMIAIGQKLFGRGREFRHYSSLILGRSIGCAHVIDRKLYRGHDGGAGEIGHVTVDPDGPLCPCGRQGCLDMYAGGSALKNAAIAKSLNVDSMRELEVLAANGNSNALALLRRGGQALGLVVASLVQINNPETVLFADLEGFGNGLFTTAVRQSIENNVLPRFLSTTKILFQTIDQSFLARGAASMALQHYLQVSG